MENVIQQMVDEARIFSESKAEGEIVLSLPIKSDYFRKRY